ncbi:MAG: anthranilate synthase component I [Lachnospiraceae bacterium]|nr:anthranilate synthase component I [Lachnospiraceae bacterium]
MKPTFEEVKAYAGKGYKRVPIAYEILADAITPIELLRKLKHKSEHCYILESVENQEFFGRYTFLGFDPELDIICVNGEITLKDVKGNIIRTEQNANPAAFITEVLKEYKSPRIEGMPSFTGGLVGYFSYDYIKYNEPKLVLNASDADGFQDVDMMLFDKVIAFDNLHQKIILIANVEIENTDQRNTDQIQTAYEKAADQIREMCDIIYHGEKAVIPKGVLKSEFQPLFDKEGYCQMVEKAKHYIYEGDIFQVVLSNRLEAEFEGSLFDTYRVLRTVNPSPYMFYFSGDDIEVAGASPETLVKLDRGVLHTFPLAGTRPRGATIEEDERLEKELLADEKERAEHNMLVDLGRNDLGKISRFGTVSVEKYMSIEKYSHVMHIGSTVSGEMKEELSPVEAINAVLPAGTLSGAPKIRACEIINELEDNKRGIYGGAIGYIDFTENLDTCIAIRIAFRKQNKVFIRSGAGIVADSVPETEFQECINKAKAVVTAIEQSQEVEQHDFIN